MSGSAARAPRCLRARTVSVARPPKDTVMRAAPRLPFGKLLLLLGAAIAIPARAAELPPASPVAGVKMDIYALPSDPPGQMREAPGGGRVLTPAVLFYPAAGENIHGPAIVMIAKGPSSNPGYAGQSTRWAAERLAAKGYTVLSIQSHADRGWPFFPFEETAFEVKAALDSLESRGYEDFALIGESYGAVAAAYYLANNADPSLDKAGVRRVHAAVLLDPLTELRQYPGVGLAKTYDTVIARAQKAFDGGHNAYTPSRNIKVGGGPRDGNESWLGTGFFIAPAEGILDYWGPQADARNDAAYRKNPVPTLAIAHQADPTVSLAKLKSIAAAKPGGMDVAPTPGSGFAVADYAAATDRIADWLGRHGLGVRPRVEQQLVDVTTADGTVLTAVIYRPEKPDPKKPAMLLVHGRSGEPIQSSTHWMGWRFAQKGYVVLSPEFRLSGPKGIWIGTRKQMTEDMGAWMNKFAELGYGKVIAAGHSNGGIWISDYLVASQDKRIEGIIYFAPTVNVETWPERQANTEEMAQMKQACAAVKAGKGTEVVFGVQSAILVCDSLSEDAVSHPERLAQIHLPAFFITGSTDPLFKRPNVHDRLFNHYPGKLDALEIPGGTHGLRESKDRLAGDVDNWIAKTFPDQR